MNLNKKICTEKEAEKILLEKTKKYEKIIIDCSNNSFKCIEKIADLYIFLTEPNLIEINKSKKLLEKYLYEFNIKQNKIKLIFNKYNFYSIDINLLKNIFYKFNILGKIKLNNKYNFIINKNIKIIDKKIKKEYIKILEKM